MPRNAQDLPACKDVVTGAAASLILHASLAAWLFSMPGPADAPPQGGNVIGMVLLGSPGGTARDAGGRGGEPPPAPQDTSPASAPGPAGAGADAPSSAAPGKAPGSVLEARKIRPGRHAAPQARPTQPSDRAGAARQGAAGSGGADDRDGTGPGAGGSGSGSPVPAVFGGGSGPAFLRYAAPAYPEQARRMGKAGVVRIRIRLDASGRLEAADVLESPHGSLSQAALRSVRNARYRPLTSGGKALPCTAVLSIRFELE